MLCIHSSVCKLQLGEIVHYRATVFESLYLKCAKLQNLFKICNPQFLLGKLWLFQCFHTPTGTLVVLLHCCNKLQSCDCNFQHSPTASQKAVGKTAGEITPYTNSTAPLYLCLTSHFHSSMRSFWPISDPFGSFSYVSVAPLIKEKPTGILNLRRKEGRKDDL